MTDRDRRGLPRLAARLLGAAVPADWRDDIVRDVEEAWAERRSGPAGGSPDGSGLRRLRRRNSNRSNEGGSGPAGMGGVRARIGALVWLWCQILVFAVRFLPVRIREMLPRSFVTSLDLKLAARSARRSWGLSVLTVVSMALGIGATTGAFGLIDGAFFSGLPFADGDRIFLVEDYNATRNSALWVGGDEYLRRRDALTSFEKLGAFYSRGVVLGTERRVTARFVTPELLEMTGVHPMIGRLPEASDATAGAEPVVLLPHDLWSSAMGGDPAAVGTRIDVAGVPRTVIGVMPPDFGFPYGNEIWIPLDAGETSELLRVIGQLREGVDVDAARAELAVVARQNPAQVQAPDDVINTLVTPLDRPVTGDAQLLFLAAPLLALVLLLVVMATNVATVVLARNATRTGEVAVRVALGASRRRVIGQLVLEVALAVAMAAALGLALARFGLAQLDARLELPFWVDFSLDPRSAFFTIALAALATAVAGLLPALRTTSGPLLGALKHAGRGASALRFGRVTDSIIIAELGVSVGFLAAAAILGQSLLSFGFARYGLPSSETLVAQLYFGQPAVLRDPGTTVSSEIRTQLWQQHFEQATRRRDLILEQSAALPGAGLAAVASRFPGDESETVMLESEDGRFDDARRVERAAVGRGYFELLGVALLQGRDFLPAEYANDIAVAVVDEPFVQSWFGGGNAIGRRVRLASEATDEAPGRWIEIVGVVPDIGLAVGDPSRSGTLFEPIRPTNVMWIGIRGDGDPNRWAPAFTEIVRRVDPEISVTGVRTLESMMMLPVTLYRALGVGFLVLGGIALLLSAASLHAVTATSVTRRTRELGIRRALGAPSAVLVRTTVRRAAVQLAIGTLLGLTLAIGLLRLATIFPWRLGPGDPRILAVVPAILAVAVLLALAGPLTRALTIRPADALRQE